MQWKLITPVSALIILESISNVSIFSAIPSISYSALLEMPYAIVSFPLDIENEWVGKYALSVLHFLFSLAIDQVHLMDKTFTG
jgi:hypothetical protein